MPSVEVNGTELAYVEQGAGEPVMLVHGSLEDMRSWRGQVQAFARHYRVIAYSRRYHYPNAAVRGGPDYSAALHAEDLAGLIVRQGAAPAHLVCSSFGGYVALYMAARRPELVRSLVLGEPPLMPWLADQPGGGPLAEHFLREAWEPARQAFERGDGEQGVAAFLNGVIGRDAFGALGRGARATLMDNAPALRAETEAEDYFSAFSCQEAGQIQRPVLLLQGETSPRMFHLILDELARCLPKAARATIPGASHAIHLGNPGAYNETVLRFLQAAD
jgi:non-heme chloroperoxidase